MVKRTIGLTVLLFCSLTAFVFSHHQGNYKNKLIDELNQQNLSNLDSHQGEKLAFAEFSSTKIKTRAEKMFSRLDRDNNHFLSSEEMLAKVRTVFSKAGKNQDGFIDQKEVKTLSKKLSKKTRKGKPGHKKNDRVDHGHHHYYDDDDYERDDGR